MEDGVLIYHPPALEMEPSTYQECERMIQNLKGIDDDWAATEYDIYEVE